LAGAKIGNVISVEGTIASAADNEQRPAALAAPRLGHVL
jgi:hypothetical protein